MSVKSSKAKSPRETVVDILEEVFEKEKLSHIVIRQKLEEYDRNTLNQQNMIQCDRAEGQDKAFVTRLAQGTIERKITLDYIIDSFSKTKVQKMKPFIRNLLRMSVYQIMYMDSVPDSAACNEAVKIAKRRGFHNLASFVNGVLRNISREKEKIEYPDGKQEPLRALSVRYSVPEWILKLLYAQSDSNHRPMEYGTDSEEMKRFIEMLDALECDRPGITVRVNVSKSTVEQAIAMLEKEGVAVKKTALAKNMLILYNAGAVSELETFKQGIIQVQDISSALVGQISGVKLNGVCMDMCAAPGGKTIHLADLLNHTGKVISNDVSNKKIGLINENIERCGFQNIITTVSDSTVENPEYYETADLVIADVPCSGLGVIRHKADIKYRLKETDIESLTNISQKILNCAVKYLKKGGILVFSTCTMTDMENDGNRAWLLENFDLKPVDITDSLTEEMLDIGNNRQTAKEGYLKLLISKDYDGFYMAKFVKE